MSGKAGMPPGTLVHIGEKRSTKAKVTIIDYNEKQFHEKEAKKIEESFSYKSRSSVTWINIDGLHQVDIIEKIGNYFGMHPLILEDILNTSQRPKVEEFEDHLFIVFKMLTYDGSVKKIDSEQVSMVLGKNFVISFQEKEGDVFEGIRERIRHAKGKIRNMGADYLVYALMDAVVDNYFTVLEQIGDNIEETEEDLVSRPVPKMLHTIKNLKNEMIFLRRSVWPLRELISNLTRGDMKFIKNMTIIFFRDVYDHTIQVIDMIESYRDMLSGLMDIYLSSISNKMNEVMKVLTIIATIFIPLTFIVGVYGMNFEFIPELKWKWGYFSVWGFMVSVFILMISFFKRKKWL